MGQTAELGQRCAISSVWGLPPLSLSHGLRRNDWLSPAENAHCTGGGWVTPQPGGRCLGAWWESNPVLKPIVMIVLAAAQRNCKIGSLPASGWCGISCHVTRGNHCSAHCGPRDRHVAKVTVLKEAWHVSLENSGNYIYHYVLTFKNCTLPTRGICLLCMSRRTNGDYTLKQYSRLGTVFCEVRTQFLDAFAKLRKARLFGFVSVRVRPHGTTRLPPDEFSWNSIFEDLS